MAGDTEDEIPESGAVFTFGKSKFAENIPSKFWFKNDVPLKVVCGDEHTALITENGKLFMFGSNNWGQLGLGEKTSVHKPTCVKSLKSEKVKLVACGRTHTLVYTSHGNLYAAGGNNEGQLGLGDVKERSSFQLVDFFTQYGPIEMLAAGSNTSAALMKDGKLFVWGDNSDGQLGLGYKEGTSTPLELTVGGPVVWISCGYYHSALVTEDGSLFTFGERDSGKLGLSMAQLANHKVPQKVEGISEHVLQVACGGGHTVVLTEDHLYSFGLGQFGQLGHGTFIFESRLPKMVEHFRKGKVKYIACGENHTAVLTESGLVYTFGDGRHGKLAQGEEYFANCFNPTLCPRFLSYNVFSVSCGGCHMLVLAKPRIRGSGSIILENNDATEDYLEKSCRKMLNRIDTQTKLNRSLSARDRRRERERSPEQFGRMFKTLPPLISGDHSELLPASCQTLPSRLPRTEMCNKKNLSDRQKNILPNSIDKRKTDNQIHRKSSADENYEDSESVKDLGETTDLLNLTHVIKMDADEKALTLSPMQKKKLKVGQKGSQEVKLHTQVPACLNEWADQTSSKALPIELLRSNKSLLRESELAKIQYQRTQSSGSDKENAIKEKGTKRQKAGKFRCTTEETERADSNSVLPIQHPAKRSTLIQVVSRPKPDTRQHYREVQPSPENLRIRPCSSIVKGSELEPIFKEYKLREKDKPLRQNLGKAESRTQQRLKYKTYSIKAKENVKEIKSEVHYGQIEALSIACESSETDKLSKTKEKSKNIQTKVSSVKTRPLIVQGKYSNSSTESDDQSSSLKRNKMDKRLRDVATSGKLRKIAKTRMPSSTKSDDKLKTKKDTECLMDFELADSFMESVKLDPILTSESTEPNSLIGVTSLTEDLEGNVCLPKQEATKKFSSQSSQNSLGRESQNMQKEWTLSNASSFSEASSKLQDEPKRKTAITINVMPEPAPLHEDTEKSMSQYHSDAQILKEAISEDVNEEHNAINQLQQEEVEECKRNMLRKKKRKGSIKQSDNGHGQNQNLKLRPSHEDTGSEGDEQSKTASEQNEATDNESTVEEDKIIEFTSSIEETEGEDKKKSKMDIFKNMNNAKQMGRGIKNQNESLEQFEKKIQIQNSKNNEMGMDSEEEGKEENNSSEYDSSNLAEKEKKERNAAKSKNCRVEKHDVRESMSKEGASDTALEESGEEESEIGDYNNIEDEISEGEQNQTEAGDEDSKREESEAEEKDSELEEEESEAEETESETGEGIKTKHKSKEGEEEDESELGDSEPEEEDNETEEKDGESEEENGETEEEDGEAEEENGETEEEEDGEAAEEDIETEDEDSEADEDDSEVEDEDGEEEDEDGEEEEDDEEEDGKEVEEDGEEEEDDEADDEDGEEEEDVELEDKDEEEEEEEENFEVEEEDGDEEYSKIEEEYMSEVEGEDEEEETGEEEGEGMEKDDSGEEEVSEREEGDSIEEHEKTEEEEEREVEESAEEEDLDEAENEEDCDKDDEETDEEEKETEQILAVEEDDEEEKPKKQEKSAKTSKSNQKHPNARKRHTISQSQEPQQFWDDVLPHYLNLK